MDQSGIKEILKALELHGAHIEKKMDERFEKVDQRFDKLEERFDRLEKKFDGHKVELLETQETVDHLVSKTAHHERKLRKLTHSGSSTN